MEASPHNHEARVIDIRTGEVIGCEECSTKDQAIARLTRSYEGTIQRLRQDLEVAQDTREGDFPFDEATEVVMRHWQQLATDSRWFSKPPKCGPTSTRWRDTNKALRGVKARNGSWDWPPRVVADLLSVSTGAFIRAEEQRNDPRFKRDYLDPCTAFFVNFDRNWEAATDPAPSRQTRARMAFEAPAVLREHWTLVLNLADECECGHPRLLHQREWLGMDDRLQSGGCHVHGCHCEVFDDDDVKARAWWDARTADLKRRPGRCEDCSDPVTADEWAAYLVVWADLAAGGKGYIHHRCLSARGQA
jgi:hypothetical protein